MQHGGIFDESKGAAKRKIIHHNGWRVGLMLLLIAVASSLQEFRDVAFCSAPVLFVVIASGMSMPYVAVRYLLILPFGLGTVLLLPVASGGDTWGLAGLLILKLSLANLGMTYILGTTPLPVLLKTMVQLRIPVPLVEMIGFTLRYASVLSDEAVSMLTAQKARGLRAGSWTNLRSYKRLGQLLGVLLMRSLERSERIHQAMLARGYDPYTQGTSAAASLAHSTSRKEGEPDGRHPRRKPVVPVSGYDTSA